MTPNFYKKALHTQTRSVCLQICLNIWITLMQTIGIKVLTIVPSCLVLTFLLPDIIFNCYLAAPRPTLDYYRGGSLTHPMLITAFLHIRPEGHREPCNEFGSLSPADRLVGFETGAFRFWLQRPNPQSVQIPLLLVFFWFSVVILLKITDSSSTLLVVCQ